MLRWDILSVASCGLATEWSWDNLLPWLHPGIEKYWGFTLYLLESSRSNKIRNTPVP